MHMPTRVNRWTLDEVHRLPDDGNKYELIHGELFVTPPPSVDHETILARLARALEPYVVRNNLGMIFHPRSVVRVKGSEAEPDLMVRRPPDTRLRNDWERLPIPILVVEVFSPYTRRRDHMQKRDWYVEIGVGEYWVVEPEERSVRVIKRVVEDTIARDTLHWHPSAAESPLEIDLGSLFGDAEQQ